MLADVAVCRCEKMLEAEITGVYFESENIWLEDLLGSATYESCPFSAMVVHVVELGSFSYVAKISSIVV